MISGELMGFSACRKQRSIHPGPGHTDQPRTRVRAGGGGSPSVTQAARP